MGLIRVRATYRQAALKCLTGILNTHDVHAIKESIKLYPGSRPSAEQHAGKVWGKMHKKCKINTSCLIFVQTLYLFMIIVLPGIVWIIHKTCARLSAEAHKLVCAFVRVPCANVTVVLLFLTAFAVIGIKVTAQTCVCQTGQSTKCRFQIEKGWDNISHTAFEPRRQVAAASTCSGWKWREPRWKFRWHV